MPVPTLQVVKMLDTQTLVLLWNFVVSMRLRMLSFFEAKPRTTGAACAHNTSIVT